MITSTSNPRVKLVRALQTKRRARQKEAAFVIEGLRMAREVVAAQTPVHLVLHTEHLDGRARGVINNLARLGAEVVAVSDTRVLARLADKTVFLVRWADTPREVATAALQQIVDSGANVIGAMLSMVDVKKHAGYGYSDSGYFYGSLRKYYTN